MAYKNRVFDVQLKAHLKAMGAVLIEGPKWCGKTTTAKQLANSVISLQDTDHREEYLSTAITKPSFLLEGNVPRLIDEWQDAPMLWDAVRTFVVFAVKRLVFLWQFIRCFCGKALPFNKAGGTSEIQNKTSYLF